MRERKVGLPLREAQTEQPVPFSPPVPLRLLTRKDVAHMLGVSTRTLSRIVAAGSLRPLRVGRQVRFHPDALDAYLRACAASNAQRSGRPRASDRPPVPRQRGSTGPRTRTSV